MTFSSCSYLVNVVHGEDVDGIFSRSRITGASSIEQQQTPSASQDAALARSHVGGNLITAVKYLLAQNALPRQDAFELTVRDRGSVVDSLLFAFIVLS